MNIQFAIQNGIVYILEVNPRASRTVPFVSKATGVPLAKMAARVMTGSKLKELGLTTERVPKFFAVKESVFPFAKFPEADPILGPEMKSTGEVMGTGRSFGEAYAKAQLASGVTLPTRGVCLISVRERDKPAAVTLARRLVAQGFEIVATSGTAKAITDAGIPCRRANKVREGRPHIVDMIKNDEISLIVNTTEGKQAIFESRSIRREAVHKRVTYYTTVAAGLATCDAIAHMNEVDVNRSAGSAPGHRGRRRETDATDAERRGAPARRAEAAEDRGSSARHPGDRRGAQPRRPERERRVSRRARAAELHRRAHQGHRSASVELRDHRRHAPAGRRQGRLRRHASIWRIRTTATRSSIRSSATPRPTSRAGWISVSSPIARALVGKSQGDIVDVVAPNGTRSYEIVAVKYV